MNVTTMWL